MSGTSLDGLDVVLVDFEQGQSFFTHNIIAGSTFPYSNEMQGKLKSAPEMTALEITSLDKEFGRVMGDFVNQFISENNLDKSTISALSSHGHTVFHQPDKGFTLQIGCGQVLSKTTQLDVVNDFRTGDVLAGGQGAPLVPMGEKHLFQDDFDGFVNLGGFCNISIQKAASWKAFDIGPCNLPLNKYANKQGLEYDKGGKMAREGEIDLELLDKMNQLKHYQMAGPKSLGTEWLDKSFYPILGDHSDTKNMLATIAEHISQQIAQVINSAALKKVLVTGGGAYNNYLIELLKNKIQAEIILPDKLMINYKEALIFAFLGFRRLKNETTTLASVTGASADQITGVFHPYF
jgi:anhydro-N-acetylmuramic acid kinase